MLCFCIGYLLQLKTSCPRIIRVYSTDVEQASYPLPPNVFASGKHDLSTRSPEDLKDVTLHHVVRSVLGEYCSILFYFTVLE
jgi:hypothetical protein